MPPGDWFVWLIMTGRGWGKTRTAIENIAKMIRGPTPLTAAVGAPAIMSIVADTAFDLRQYSVEGPSGFLNVGPPSFRPRYHPGQSTLIWPNGCKALLFSAEDPEVTRASAAASAKCGHQSQDAPNTRILTAACQPFSRHSMLGPYVRATSNQKVHICKKCSWLQQLR